MSRVRFGPDGAGLFSYQWTATVPAAETVIFMHFAVQREPGDAAAAQAQAEALRDLSDPKPLSGVNPEERARTRNFIVP